MTFVFEDGEFAGHGDCGWKKRILSFPDRKALTLKKAAPKWLSLVNLYELLSVH